MPSESVEDYIKSIFKLSGWLPRVTTTALAEKMRVSSASATNMMKRLAREGYVSYEPYQGVELTEEGRKTALRVLRYHRLLEQYLHQVVGLSWSGVHSEACRLEHCISEEFAERIAERLGHPEKDPHGDPIPTADWEYDDRRLPQLGAVGSGEEVVVERIADGSPKILDFFMEAGILPGVEVRVLERSREDRLKIEVGGREMEISPDVSMRVLVSEAARGGDGR